MCTFQITIPYLDLELKFDRLSMVIQAEHSNKFSGIIAKLKRAKRWAWFFQFRSSSHRGPGKLVR